MGNVLVKEVVGHIFWHLSMHLSQSSHLMGCESFNKYVSNPQVCASYLPDVQLKIVRSVSLKCGGLKFHINKLCTLNCLALGLSNRPPKQWIPMGCVCQMFLILLSHLSAKLWKCVKHLQLLVLYWIFLQNLENLQGSVWEELKRSGMCCQIRVSEGSSVWFVHMRAKGSLKMWSCSCHVQNKLKLYLFSDVSNYLSVWLYN